MSKRTGKNPKSQKRTLFFRAWKTLKDGTRIYAKDYGYKAWPLSGPTK
jgi:hypothetical protein